MDDMPREALQAMHDAWPKIAQMERKMRHTDWQLTVLNVVAAVFLATMALMVDSRVSQGFYIGSLFSIGWGCGVLTVRVRDRRRHFGAMREAHEAIELELAFHHDE
jgi:hypothetical protein